MIDVITYTLLGLVVLGSSIRLGCSFGVLPKPIACDCNALRGWHENSYLMFMTGASCVVLALIYAGTEGPRGFPPVVIHGALGGWCLYDWWKHTRRNRKKLLDKAIGVVRETAAGLKVVPVPAGARA